MATQTVLFNPFNKQLEFIEALLTQGNGFVLYGGAIRGGKTYALLGAFILFCKLFPKSKYVVVRKDLPRIKRNVLPVFDQICPPNFLKSAPSASNEWTATFTNGSQIMFFAENFAQDKDLSRFKGLEYDSIGIEEMDINEETFNKAFERTGSWLMTERKEQRLRGKPTPPQIVCGTCNPSQGWVKDRIYNKWREGKLQKGWVYIPSRVFDNPYIESEWIEDKKANMNPLNYQRFVEGDWDVNMNEQPFFYEFDVEKHVSKDVPPINVFEPLWLSFDFNVNPTTCVVGQKIYGKGLIIHDVVQVAGGTRLLCESLLIYKDYILKITGDRSGANSHTAAGMVGGEFTTDYSIIREMLGVSKKHLYETHAANKLHTYSRSLCNSVFFKLPITINAKCEELIRDLQVAQPDKNGRLVKDRDIQKQDAGDAFRYMINAWFVEGMKDINSFENLLL